MAVSKRLRYEILRRDNHACRYCGATAPDAKLVVDHVTPTALGGTDTPNNLVTACEPCNSGKSSASPDHGVVADVASDALRWAAAIKQAAAELEAQEAPKRQYQKAFRQAWDEWTYELKGESKTTPLDDNWRTSLDRFRLAGLPATVWPDIVERAMTHPTVKLENRFRYACGIAWGMITDLQKRAQALLAPVAVEEQEDSRDLVAEAALEVWVNEWSGDPSDEQGNNFEASVQQLRENGGEDAHRILQAAQFAAWFHRDSITGVLSELDAEEVERAWSAAWFAAAGEFPGQEEQSLIVSQTDALLGAGVHVGRLVQAAVHAGAHRSATLCFGLSSAELAVTGRSDVITRAFEIWVTAFSAASDRWPTREERIAFHRAIAAVSDDGDFLVRDLYAAAAAAGAYQDTDLSTCIPRNGSVFEAAAKPLLRGAA